MCRPLVRAVLLMMVPCALGRIAPASTSLLSRLALSSSPFVRSPSCSSLLLSPVSPCPLLPPALTMASSRPSSDLAAFREKLCEAKHVVAFTGAGISAESGVPTFRGDGGLWRTHDATSLATPEAFERDPSLVWEFYHYRRELVMTKRPNPAHHALVGLERWMGVRGRRCVVVTQNIDELHRTAGTEELIEVHGSLFRVRCLACGEDRDNYDSPICEALRGKGAPDPGAPEARIPEEDLPRCRRCRRLLRPAVLWFGEMMDERIMQSVLREIDSCDLCLVVGTSSLVYPAALFAPQAARRGAVVAEFNLEETPATESFQFHFHGPCGETLPPALTMT